MGLFGGDSSATYTKKSSSTVHTASRTQDQRIGVEGGLGGGLLAGPESNVALPGAIATRVGDFSTMTQSFTGNKFRVGMTSAEVKDIVTGATAQNTAQLAAVSDFGQSALSAVSAARTGEPSDYTRYIPYVIVGLIALAVVRRGRS
jgi:hypothetical protein